MNPGIAGIVFLALVTLGSALISIVYYVRHWSQRQQRLSRVATTEGVFFKRYLPEPIRDRYDRQRLAQTDRLNRRILIAKLVITAGAGGSLALIALIAMLVTRDRLNWLDLTAEEIGSLRHGEYQWSRKIDENLPRLDTVLGLLRNRVVVLVSADEDRHPWGGTSTGTIAESQWSQFLGNHAVMHQRCGWSAVFDQCAGAGIYIVTPGRWNPVQLAQLLNQGESVLLYGPPAQVFDTDEPYPLFGLRFEQRKFKTRRQLAVVGDQVLTLGFDAGLITDVKPVFSGYAVRSDNPQAVAIGGDRLVGGEVLTRLYALQHGKGRLVWMDFSPNPQDHPASPNAHHLNALTAAVFRYLLRMEYSGWASWPGGKRFAGVLAVDSEDKFEWARHVVTLVRRLNAPITWFVLSHEAQKNRSLTREMAATGEIACHGDSHASFPSGERPTQVQRIARCRKVLLEITGRVAHGFRPPDEAYDDATIDAVGNNDMGYIFAETGEDRAVPILWLSNTPAVSLVSLPRIGSDDYELWHTRKLGFRESLDVANNELRWAEVMGGLYIFDFHTQFMTDEHLKVVEHYGNRLKRDDVYFATAGEISDWWRVRTRLARGEAPTMAEVAKYRPVILTVRPDGSLARLNAKEPKSGPILARRAIKMSDQ
jgi:peptidoglycan/xylan/chitin deacetylase (PgdA/CDA1 family)